MLKCDSVWCYFFGGLSLFLWSMRGGHFLGVLALAILFHMLIWEIANVKSMLKSVTSLRWTNHLISVLFIIVRSNRVSTFSWGLH